MRLSLKSIVIATAALGAFGLAQGQLPDWVKYVRSTSGFSEAFFRPVALPGGPLFTRRPPVETVEWLAARIEATPNNAQLYALRARESERLLDFAAADNDWNEFAAQVADPAEGQLALADFYRRRLRPVDEVEALLALASAAPGQLYWQSVAARRPPVSASRLPISSAAGRPSSTSSKSANAIYFRIESPRQPTARGSHATATSPLSIVAISAFSSNTECSTPVKTF